MSRPHSLRCIFASPQSSGPLSRSFLPSFSGCRHLHSSSTHQARPPPKFPNIKASTLGLTTPKYATPTTSRRREPTTADLPGYSPADLKTLKKNVSPAQFAAIEAGEAAIDPADILAQGAIRSDPMAVKYLDDFTDIRAVIDHPIRNPEENYDPKLRFKEEDEIAADLGKWMESLASDPDPESWVDFEKNTRLTVGKPEAELAPRSYEAPEIPEMTDPMTRSAVKNAAAGNDDDGSSDPHMQRLMKQTGMDFLQIRSLRLKILNTHGVVNQTRMGKVRSSYYLTVAGNGHGMVGIGEGKSTEPEDARRQSAANAVRNMVPVVRYEERTIFGDVQGKVGASELKLMTRPPGMLSCALHQRG